MLQISAEKFHTTPTFELSEQEKAIYSELERLNIPFEGVGHEAAFTIEQCHDIETVLQTEICKNLVLINSNKSSLYFLMMNGDKKFLTKVLSKEIGSTRLSFAGDDYLNEYLNTSAGSCSCLELIFDKKNRLQLLVDRDLLSDEYIGVHPGINTSTLKIKTTDLLDIYAKTSGHDYTVVDL